MSTARSIRRRFYTLALIAGAASACKKRSAALDPEEQGKLPRIAQRLEEAFATRPLPNLTEPERFADRLAQWDDFRSCTVRSYVAKKRAYDQLKREGAAPPDRHASIGEAAVEECAVQSAVANKDPSMCQRLAVDYEGPMGAMPFATARCWDTRARVLGLPDECPVQWFDDVPGRGPECLAAARRDESFCRFADNPPRCRAILAGDPAACEAPGAAPDCPLAAAYWSGLVPAAEGPPLIDLATPTKPGDKPLRATVDVRWPDRPTLRIEGQQRSCAVSWPGGKAQVATSVESAAFWGAKIPPEAVQIGWRAGAPAVKIAFAPAGASSGDRPVQPPGPAAGATVILVWPDPRNFRRCLPGPQTTGLVHFDAGAAQVGSFVTGTASAENLACSDGTTVSVHAEFRLVILDVR